MWDRVGSAFGSDGLIKHLLSQRILPILALNVDRGGQAFSH